MSNVSLLTHSLIWSLSFGCIAVLVWRNGELWICDGRVTPTLLIQKTSNFTDFWVQRVYFLLYRLCAKMAESSDTSVTMKHVQLYPSDLLVISSVILWLIYFFLLQYFVFIVVAVMDKALFTSVPQSDFSTVSNNEHEHYLAEIKRIRNEIAGFRPIETTDKPSKNVTKVPPKVATKPVNNKTRPLGGNTAVKTTTAGYKRAVYYWRIIPSSWQLPIYIWSLNTSLQEPWWGQGSNTAMWSAET